jgi:hypothetical protein
MGWSGDDEATPFHHVVQVRLVVIFRVLAGAAGVLEIVAYLMRPAVMEVMWSAGGAVVGSSWGSGRDSNYSIGAMVASGVTGSLMLAFGVGCTEIEFEGSQSLFCLCFLASITAGISKQASSFGIL